MPKLQILLSAVDHDLSEAWRRWCGDLPFVEVHHGSILDLTADAIVSPANSFGFMDGGIDRVYSERFGWAVQDRVQQAIRDHHHGELLVGAAEIVRLDDPSFRFLIAAPTMRVPQVLNSTVNCYLAARAVFLLIREGTFRDGPHAGERIRNHVSSVAIPGLGTGVGRVPSVQCARQVRAAIEDVVQQRFEFPETTSQIRKRHDRMVDYGSP